MKEPGTHLNQISNKSLRERVTNVLRDAIIHGDMKPGHILVETELAAQLGVSRAPLREAIQTLNTEGLLETVPYHGTTVRRLTRNDIEELYSLRGELEAFAIRRIITQDDPDHIAQLRAIYEDMLTAADAGDLKQVNEIDRLFHDTIIQLSRHSLLVATWSSVALRVRQVMALTNKRNSVIKQIAYNHLPIIETIASGDEAAAVAAIKQHVASSGGLIADGWDDEAGQANL